MTERVYVHVGPSKTGTTYLQGLLEANVDALRDQGVLYPGGSFFSQSRAIHDALGRRSLPSSDRDITGEWQRLADEIHSWPGRAAVISHETLSAATRKDVARLHDRLGAFDVHVILTARDLGRVAPAMWQTTLRNRGTSTWPEYLAALRAPRRPSTTGGGRQFWRSQDTPAVLERWRAHVPLESLHVVTVPRPDSPRELLWRRFCLVLGVDTTGHHLWPRRANPSLGVAEAELLRRVNSRLAGADITTKNWLFWTRWLGRELEERAAPARLTIPRGDLDWLTDRAERIVRQLRETGYPVVGDLDELLPQAALPPEVPDQHPPVDDPASDASEASAPSEAELLDVALDALQHTMRQLAATDYRPNPTS